MKTAPTNKKIREIITMVKEKKLVPRPEFQRRLVWTHQDKNFFLDSILRGFPFPEIYLADGNVDLESGEGTQLLVDGLQRVSTILEYFEASPNLRLYSVPPYKELKEEEKKAFLQYDVAVRDIGAVRKDELIEVFKRINATQYSLLDIEVNNAVYNGALKQFGERIAGHLFFVDNGVFNAQDYKRMGDLKYALALICTMLQGYFNREDVLGKYLEQFNDEFPLASELDQRFVKLTDYLEECGFDPRSRLWKKADLFTVLVELDAYFQNGKSTLSPSDFIERIQGFYDRIDVSAVNAADLAAVYYKAAIQATNDKINRLRRGIIIGGLIRGYDDERIYESLKAGSLITGDTTPKLL